MFSLQNGQISKLCDTGGMLEPCYLKSDPQTRLQTITGLDSTGIKSKQLATVTAFERIMFIADEITVIIN